MHTAATRDTSRGDEAGNLFQFLSPWGKLDGAKDAACYAPLERAATEADVQHSAARTRSDTEFGRYKKEAAVLPVPKEYQRDDWYLEQPPRSANYTWCVAATQWLLPFFFCGFSNLLMSVMLHIGTYFYIHVMLQFEKAYKFTGFQDTMVPLSPGLTIGNYSYGSLEDPAEEKFGWKAVSLKELDTAALVLPACWFVLIMYKRDIHLWTKTLVCHGFLALLKGLLSFLTVVPDSIGWQGCKARLGSNLDIIADLPDPSFNFWAAVRGIIKMEIHGYVEHKPVRFCADMLYSGHTFVTCLYGFALVELTRKAFIDKSKTSRIIIQLCVSAFFGLEQLYEIHAVLLNRFHYTMDIVLAIIMVLLWYTNGTMLLSVQKWSKLGKAQHHPLPSRKYVASKYGNNTENHKARTELEDMILAGNDRKEAQRWEFIEKSKASDETQANALKKGLIVVDTPEKNANEQREELPVGLQMWAFRWGLGLFPRRELARKDGDIWVPPACLPFACFVGGRQSLIENSWFEKYDPHEMHQPDPAWCDSCASGAT